MNGQEIRGETIVPASTGGLARHFDGHRLEEALKMRVPQREVTSSAYQSGQTKPNQEVFAQPGGAQESNVCAPPYLGVRSRIERVLP